MSAIDIIRSFAESREADAVTVRDGITYGTCREVVAAIADNAARVREMERRVSDLKFALGDGAGWFDRFVAERDKRAAAESALAEARATIERVRRLASSTEVTIPCSNSIIEALEPVKP